MDVAHYTSTNALFNEEIKNVQIHHIFFEYEFFKPMKVKGDGSHFYWAVASHVTSNSLNMFGLVDSPCNKVWNKQVTFEI